MSIKIIELFAGIGTQRKAFENVYGKDNIEIVGISEIDQKALKAYTLLHGKTNNFGDITLINRLPYADVWTYSFPCTDISIAGKQVGLSGQKSSLLYHVQRLLEVSEKPKVLIMENVANLVSDKFIADFEAWIATLKEIGYTTTWKKIKAYEYGGVSIRNRVFAISILGNNKYDFPKATGTQLIVKDILEPPEDKNKISEKCLYAEVQPNYKKSIKLADYGNGGQGNRIYSIFGQGVTLTASGGGKAGSSGGLYARPDGIYKLSGIEMMKLMGWSKEDAIILEKNTTPNELGFLLGNAIDLKVMETIVSNIKI